MTYDELATKIPQIDQAFYTKDYRLFQQAVMAAYSVGITKGFQDGMDSVLASLRRVKEKP